MKDEFVGKVVMITGGGTGIGAATVERFASLGADVACCYNKSVDSAQALARKVKSDTGRDIFLVKVDVTSDDAVRAAVDSIAEHFGRPISVLINNAGDSGYECPLGEIDESFWDRIVTANLKSVFLCTKYSMPAMIALGGGRIINTTSISARAGVGVYPYVAAKAGVEAYTRSLARDFAGANVTVNCVAPGLIDTAMLRSLHSPESMERCRKNIPLQKIGEPDEVAGVFVFLASKDASYITGMTLPINGGSWMD